MNRKIQITAFLLASMVTLGLTGCPHHHHHHHPPPPGINQPGPDHHGPPPPNGYNNGPDHR